MELDTIQNVQRFMDDFVEACNEGRGSVRRKEDQISCTTANGNMTVTQDKATGEVYVTGESRKAVGYEQRGDQLTAQLKNPDQVRHEEGTNTIRVKKRDGHEIGLKDNHDLS